MYIKANDSPYAGFMIISCTLGQKRELRKLQNRGIHTCLLYGLQDRISIQRLHNGFKILGLEQRRRMQLLKILYYRSKNQVFVKVPVRETGANVKIVFDVMSRTTTKYLNSPFLRGAVLWDGLPVEIQRRKTCVNLRNH